MRPAQLGSLLAAAALVATASPATADPAHDPTASCDGSWHRQGPLLVFTGYATAPAGHPQPMALSVTCTFSMVNGDRSLTATSTTPGYAAVVSGSGWLGADTVRICQSAEAHYQDGHVGRYGPVCFVPTAQ